MINLNQILGIFFTMKIDDIDLNILRLLLDDNKMSTKDIAARVNLSITPVHERIKKLEAEGIISKNVVLLNLEKLGYPVVGYLQIKLIKHHEDIFQKFEEKIKSFSEVIEASFVAGEYDVILKIILKDMQAYHNFILHKISNLDYISGIKSNFVIKYLTDNHQSITGEQFGKLI